VTDVSGVAVGRCEAVAAVPPAHDLVAVATIARPIRIGHEVVGEVVAEAGLARDQDLDVRAVEHAATVLAVHVAKEREARAAEGRLQSDFVFDLLHERDDEERLRRRARHHGLDLASGHRVVAVDVHAGDEPSCSRALTAVRAVLAEHFPSALFSEVGEGLVAVVPAGGPARVDLVAVEQAAERLLERVAELGLGQSASVGVGRGATGLAGLVRSHREARRCVDVLARLDHPRSVMVADDLGILDLFLDTDRVDDLRDLPRDSPSARGGGGPDGSTPGESRR
jgi:sugar diacid utilization regulator